MSKLRQGIHIGGAFDAMCFNDEEHFAKWLANKKAHKPVWESLNNPNGIVTSATPNGLNGILNRDFRAATQITAWYIGLINNSGFSALSASDTLSSHAGWAEFTGYTISGGSALNRATWSADAAAGGILTNSSAAAFTMTSGVTVYGAFVCADQAKATTTGALWATGAFSGTQTLIIGQVLNVTYTLTAS